MYKSVCACFVSIRHTALLFAVLVAVLFVMSDEETFAEAIWQSREGNSQNTSYSSLAGPTSPVVRWVRTDGIMVGVEHNYFSSPVVASDGTVYIPDYDMLAINPDSTTKWRYTVSGILIALTVDFEDGVIGQFSGTSPARQRHLDANGVILPNLPVGGPVAIGSNGLFFGASSDYFRGVDADGNIIWSIPTESGNSGSVGVGPDGTVYLADRSSLHAVDPDTGSILWTYDRGTYHEHRPKPTIGSDGTIFTNNHSTFQAVALSPDGSVKWTNDDVYSSQLWRSNVLVDESGESYWVNHEGGIYALDADGNTMWSRSMNPRRNAALTGNGIIYVTDGTDAAHAVLRAISTSTGEDLWVFDAGANIQLLDVAIGGDGLLYVTGRDWDNDGDGLIYAIVPEPASVVVLTLLLATQCSRVHRRINC